MQQNTIYIVGVDHLIQYRNSIVPAYLFDEFKEYLFNLINTYSITAVAEEFNSEYLDDVYLSDEAIVDTAAEKSGVMHIFCDPDKDVRENLGIPYSADIRNAVKEKYGIKEKFIHERKIREKIENETAALSKKYWHLREEYWYKLLSEIPERRVLFVCGHDHVFRFQDLLKKTGRSFKVVEPFWHKEIFSDYKNLGIY